MSSRADDLDADEASEHADESAGPRIARRIWGPVTKDVSESIGAPAAVASVQLQPRCIPFELLQEVHALVPVEVLPTAEDTTQPSRGRWVGTGTTTHHRTLFHT